MGTAILKLKMMPKSPDTDLEKMKQGIREKIEAHGGVLNPTEPFEEQEIAFGLKSLTATFAWPEEKDTDLAENSAAEVEGVSSVEIVDYRRAMG
jgi:translation elongation factor aEF-1 beta